MNSVTLPYPFADRMQSLLKDSFPDYLASFEKPAVKAFHLNTARTEHSVFYAWIQSHRDLLAADQLKGTGICLSAAEGIGHHPLHHAGVLYSQDPSAQLVLDGVEITGDMRILDLCAAPGGKTSQLARAVDGGSGVVVANEPHPARSQILLGNMERMGYRNVCVISLDPSEIAMLYPEYFDLVLVDAPCSGEGMFRKYPESISEWSLENVAHCQDRGRDILRSAVSCLRPGGRLIYSTCTYATEENEDQVHFLQNEFGLEMIPAPASVQKYALETDPGCYRCYPHLYPGEGQFMAYLQKPGIPEEITLPGRTKNSFTALSAKERSAFEELFGIPAASFPLYSWRSRIIALPFTLPRIPARNVSCLGVTVMEWDEKRKRYIPHHQFFSAYGNLLPQKLDYAPEDPDLLQFLCGAELMAPEQFRKGHAAICCLGASAGGVRIAGGRMKNLYPKGLREHT
ncbi:MAG: hypothetical protein IKH46_14200 [Lachnospiraceae bacterium]|nr:hypothetical protein [Lachnospiraceae bacterium]